MSYYPWAGKTATYVVSEINEINSRMRSAEKERDELRQQLDQKQADLDRALARVAELEEYEPSQLFSAFRMRFQAKALEERVAYIEQKARAKSLGDAAIISHLKQYANHLRQQADQQENTHDPRS